VRALISEPGFFLDLGKARLPANRNPQPGAPPDRARSMIGLIHGGSVVAASRDGDGLSVTVTIPG
jgi:hypothetical protein